MSNKIINLFGILKNEGKLTRVKLYPSTETIADPYEKNTTKGFLNPITIKAYVTSLSFESLRWKYYGNIPMGSKQLLCENKWLNLLKIADKIQIGNNYYKCYQDDSKGFAVMEKEDYLIAILERKNV